VKAHVGVDADSGIVHSLETTTAKVHDSRVWDNLLHGGETSVWTDQAYVNAARAEAFVPARQVLGCDAQGPQGAAHCTRTTPISTARSPAYRAIAPKLGCSPGSLRVCCQRAAHDAGERPGLTSKEKARLEALVRENQELHQANDILKKAPAYFAPPLGDAMHHLPGNGTARDRPFKR
jgi:transposase-like protein